MRHAWLAQLDVADAECIFWEDRDETNTLVYAVARLSRWKALHMLFLLDWVERVAAVLKDIR